MEPNNKFLLNEIFMTKRKMDWIDACVQNEILDDLFLKYRKEKNYFQMRKILIHYLDKLSSEVISSLSNRMWEFISYYNKLSEDFIRKYSDKVSWDIISWYQILSEDFIREFKDKVSWDFISYKQVLSEDFMREFANKLHWDCITRAQILSEEFIRDFKDKLDWENMPLYNIPGASEFF